jgi:hypothetical protein
VLPFDVRIGAFVKSRRLATLVAVAIAAPLILLGHPALAQVSEWRAEMVPLDSAAAPTPWGPGEHLVYKAKVGFLSVGNAWLTVEGMDLVRGHPTYRAAMGIQGRFIVGLDDLYKTWFDVATLQSWRFTRDMNQGSYSSVRHYEFYPDSAMWDREDNDEFGPMSTDSPLDEIAFVYFLRTLPLEVGRTYTFDQYFKDTGNPIVVEVVRKDRRKTDAGEFNTIVVRPSFQSEGLFSEDGEAELHFSDDERRLLVYMKVDLPVIPGGLSLHLESVHEGFPVNPTSRAEVLDARERRALARR